MKTQISMQHNYNSIFMRKLDRNFFDSLSIQIAKKVFLWKRKNK